MRQPQISIIVPIFKAEDFLRECLESIRQQTFTDWECILVDDGSPDSSGAICDDYAVLDERFRVLHMENGGPSKARNVGIASAKGKFLTFLDSDDMMSTSTLQLLVDGMIDSDFVMMGYNSVTPDGSQVSKCTEFAPAQVEGTRNMLEYLFTMIDYSLMPFFCYGKLYKMSIIRQHNIRFDEVMSLGEDRMFVLQYMTYCKSWHIASNCGVKVRQSATGTSLSSKKRAPEDAFLNFCKNYEYLYSLSCRFQLVSLKTYADKFLITRIVDYIICPHTDSYTSSCQLFRYFHGVITPFLNSHKIESANIPAGRYRVFARLMKCSSCFTIAFAYYDGKLRKIFKSLF